MCPLRRHLSVKKDRLDGAFWHACFAIDARIRINVQHAFVLIEAVARTNRDTIGVLAIAARFANYMGHEQLLGLGIAGRTAICKPYTEMQK
jgi:hypothetical protein